MTTNAGVVREADSKWRALAGTGPADRRARASCSSFLISGNAAALSLVRTLVALWLVISASTSCAGAPERERVPGSPGRVRAPAPAARTFRFLVRKNGARQRASLSQICSLPAAICRWRIYPVYLHRSWPGRPRPAAFSLH